MYTRVKLKSLNCGTRIATWTLKLGHNIIKRRHSYRFCYIILQTYCLLKLFVINKLSHCTAFVLSHSFHYVVTLGMHRTIVKRVFSTWYTQETRTLYICYRTKTGNLLQFSTRLKGTVLVSILYDILGCRGIQSADIHQQVTTCRVKINTNSVNTRLYNYIQTLLQLSLINIMLILADTYTLGIYLHKLGKWIHKSSTYRNSTTNSNILIRKLLACSLGCRIYRCTILANHKNINIRT